MRGDVCSGPVGRPLSPAALKVWRATRPQGALGGLRPSPPAANEAATVAPKSPACEQDEGVLWPARRLA